MDHLRVGAEALSDGVQRRARPLQAPGGHGQHIVAETQGREHLAGAPARAQTVKLADLIDNCDDICRRDPRFGRVFLVEMGELMVRRTAYARERLAAVEGVELLHRAPVCREFAITVDALRSVPRSSCAGLRA